MVIIRKSCLSKKIKVSNQKMRRTKNLHMMPRREFNQRRNQTALLNSRMALTTQTRSSSPCLMRTKTTVKMGEILMMSRRT